MKYLYFENLERDLIILLYLVNSDVNMDEYLDRIGAKSSIPFGMFPAEERILEDTILDSSLRLRLLDDRFAANKKKPQLHYREVGTIKIGTSTDSLNQRTAINKLIHASEFNISNGIFNGVGLNKKQKWEANVDLKKYGINGLCMLTQYQEDWDLSQ